MVKNDTKRQNMPPDSNLQPSANSKGELKKVRSQHSKKDFISKADPKHVQLPCIHANLAEDGSKINIASAPIELRMAIKVNKVQYLKNTTKPKAATLPVSLPTWDEWPLDSKIPDYRNKAFPEGSLYFTRGKLGNTLYQSKREFDLSDPNCQRQPFALSGYTALHDPHALRFFQPKYIIPLLQKNELINSKNEVLCNNKDYNRFRNYLASIQSEGVQLKLRNSDFIQKVGAKIQKPFQSYKEVERNPETHSDRLNKARSEQQKRLDERSARGAKQMLKWEQQIQEIDKEKKLKRFISIQRLPAIDYVSKQRAYIRKVDDIETRKRILGKSLFNTKRASYNAKYDKFISRVLKSRAEIDKLITLKKRDEQLIELKSLMDESSNVERKAWVKRYEKHIKYSQKHQKEIQAGKKAKADRELYIERKYFDMWRDYVIAKRETELSSTHISAFNIDRILKSTILYLNELSGYDPKQNLFSNLLQNRNNIGGWVNEEKRKSEWSGRKSRKSSDFSENDGSLSERKNSIRNSKKNSKLSEDSSGRKNSLRKSTDFSENDGSLSERKNSIRNSKKNSKLSEDSSGRKNSLRKSKESSDLSEDDEKSSERKRSSNRSNSLDQSKRPSNRSDQSKRSSNVSDKSKRSSNRSDRSSIPNEE